jgi:hypothetical protein
MKRAPLLTFICQDPKVFLISMDSHAKTPTPTSSPLIRSSPPTRNQPQSQRVKRRKNSQKQSQKHMAKKNLTKKTPTKKNSNLAQRRKQTEVPWYCEHWVNPVSKQRPNDFKRSGAAENPTNHFKWKIGSMFTLLQRWWIRCRQGGA